MKIPVVIWVGLALTIGCFFLYFFQPPFIVNVSLKLYDALIRSTQAPPKTSQIVIVDLDDDSLQRVGQWPWSRYVLAELTRRIMDAKASVLAFDIVFPEPDRTSPVVLRQAWEDAFQVKVRMEGLPPAYEDFDRIFGQALAGRKTILGCAMQMAPQPVTNADESLDPYYRNFFYDKASGRIYANTLFNTNLVQSDFLTMSIPVLNSNAGNNAFFNTLPDDDNVIRSTPLIWAYGPLRIYPSLALEAVRLHLGIDKVGIEYDYQGVIRLRLKDRTIPTDEHGRAYLNFRSLNPAARYGFGTFPSYPAVKVLTGEVGEKELGGKIVFLGTSAVGLRDMRATPITGEFSGVEVHATLADNILAGDVLRNPRWMKFVEMGVLLLTGLFLTLVIQKNRAWISFVVMLLTLGAALGVSFFLLHSRCVIFIPSYVILVVVTLYPVLTMLKFWEEERQRRQVRKMFGTMVSHEVLRYLEDHPGCFSLAGKKADATMFFSDVAGFTSISENLDPEKLSELLNRYLSPMTTIIMNRDGYVDKYEGDAIMAVWGVPFPLPNHAVQACLAALEQQETLEVLRPFLKNQFGYNIHVRMGLNSGRVTAGNMGSEERQQFTVMGDAVNQAARLEPVNKDYGTLITIGETTFEQARAHIEARLLDKLVVTGKTVPVHIYELMGKKGAVPAPRQEVAGIYEEALRLHWERDWDRAEERLARCLRIQAADGPSLNLQKRLALYRRQPPPEEWRGEHIRGSKD
ncbi:MAG: adenylate/guanylate cyclase domain-containing protein [Lentisphaerae bacterium]|nr:adenylate/guanylate cyclase domain-containing protein [Lentisphaerota bacterium]